MAALVGVETTAFDFSERWGKPRTTEELAASEYGNSWEALLERGFRKSRSPDSNVIFVGDAGCGKATLVSRLCASRAGAGDPAASSAHAGVLAYNFVDAIDPTEADADADDPGVARISFYSLGMTQFGELLDIPLQSGTLEQTVVMIGIDLSKPWRALDSLREWLALVETRVTHRLGQLAEPRRCELQRRVLLGESGAGVADERPPRTISACPSPLSAVGPTPSLESFDDNRRVQFIQQRLRRECLDYGAALMFVSAKADTNCTLLHQLLWQRLYPSATDALEPQHEHDRVFVPSGWDSPQLIEGLGSWGSDMEFNEAIVAPAHEVTCSTPAVRLPARRLRVTSPAPLSLLACLSSGAARPRRGSRNRGMVGSIVAHRAAETYGGEHRGRAR